MNFITTDFFLSVIASCIEFVKMTVDRYRPFTS